jgi:uncharacterized protein YjiS (DUF1127 family)
MEIVGLARRRLSSDCTALVVTLSTWSQRSRQRALLAALDDRMLQDIGISRAQALSEAEKACWRP